MFFLNRSGMILVAAALGIACTACQSKTNTSTKGGERGQKPAKMLIEPESIVQQQQSAQSEAPEVQAEHKPAVARKSKPQQPVPPLTIPKVALSNELRVTCLVNVGDTMPEVELPDLSGKMHALDSLYGQKLTVVCFWTIGTTHRSQLTADAILRDLAGDIAGPYGSRGIGVLAIDVGDSPAAVDKMAAQAGATFPCLLDPRGDYFARIATDKRMPRTFLLDANGRILWFDVEYSRPSRRDLLQCIHVALGEL